MVGNYDIVLVDQLSVYAKAGFVEANSVIPVTAYLDHACVDSHTSGIPPLRNLMFPVL
jgi:hypothetical protein